MANRTSPTESTHERFARDEKIVVGSCRSFGMVMAAFFAIVTAINAWLEGSIWPWTGGIAAVFFVVAMLCPGLLGPLNTLWFKFGLLLHKIINPLVMGMIFYVTILPTGLIMRALGKDLLKLKHDPNADSYWIPREPAGPTPETFTDQF